MLSYGLQQSYGDFTPPDSVCIVIATTCVNMEKTCRWNIKYKCPISQITFSCSFAVQVARDIMPTFFQKLKVK